MTGPFSGGHDRPHERNQQRRGSPAARPKEGRIVAGVCAGLAVYFKVDAYLVRLLFGVFTFIWGLGALLYVLAWAILPEEGEGQSIVESFVNRLVRLTSPRIGVPRIENRPETGIVL